MSELTPIERVRCQLLGALPEAKDSFTMALHAIVMNTKAKYLRPKLLLLGSLIVRQTVGNDNNGLREIIVQAAAALELVHCASLIHDDILDEASKRRGMPSLHVATGVKQAIIAGDYLFSSALYLAAPSLDGFLAQAVGKTVRILCQGEILQSQTKMSPKEPSFRRYRRQVAGKTASLLVLALRGGAELELRQQGIIDPLLTEALGRWAYAMGIAFQINDDLLDYRLNSPKNSFKDWDQGIYNLPLLLALQHEHNQGEKALLQLCQKHAGKLSGARNSIRNKLVYLIEKYQGFTQAQIQISIYRIHAHNALKNLSFAKATMDAIQSMGEELLAEQSSMSSFQEG